MISGLDIDTVYIFFHFFFKLMNAKIITAQWGRELFDYNHIHE